eukprot:6203149-Pleurochrysis_carterae.AAC.1
MRRDRISVAKGEARKVTFGKCLRVSSFGQLKRLQSAQAKTDQYLRKSVKNALYRRYQWQC